MKRTVSRLLFFQQQTFAGSRQGSHSGPELAQGRFLSLDIFRGITVCLMIIVNSPGKGADLYPALIHAKWFGFTLADLVFPSFLFAVGNAMSFSMDRMATASSTRFFSKVLKRTLLIFLIGYLLYWFPFVTQHADGTWSIKPFSETRIMGVLQRIALCYLVAAILVRYVSKDSWIAVVCIAILIVYWFILEWFGDPGNPFDMNGNAVRKLDLFVLGHGHIYKRDSIPFDPEGLLSTLPSIVNVLAGYLAGRFIQLHGRKYDGLIRLMVTGTLMITLALFIHPYFPVSKKLWTSSFVLLSIGIDLCVMTLLVYFIEMGRQRPQLYFFTVFGKNPLFIYLLSEVLFITINLWRTSSGDSLWHWISANLFQKLAPGSAGALVGALVFTFVCWLAGWWLDRRKIYIRL